eukprot:TRINITY_DN20653_c0_g1_i1.p1 TRINITY_DN20653_c0_g1~~TRINITY_DN20653_c0_g1_i1.p1  ORF type:complete len:273 (-),score=23.73 TRINITY_DN20653_c0_g1_i1:110-928(-)
MSTFTIPTKRPAECLSHVEDVQARKKQLRDHRKEIKPKIRELRSQQKDSLAPLHQRRLELHQARQQLKALPKEQRSGLNAVMDELREIRNKIGDVKKHSKHAMQELRGNMKTEGKQVSTEQKQLWAALKENWTTALPPLEERDQLRVVVDGNNIICDRNSNLTKDSLVATVHQLCVTQSLSPEKALVVFDHGGMIAKEFDESTGLAVWHSGEGTNADDMIISHLHELITEGTDETGDVLVVTCDRVLALRAMEAGANVMKCNTFLQQGAAEN